MSQHETWTVSPGMQVADLVTGVYGRVSPGGPVWSAPVTITDAQVLALDTAHVDIVPAPTDPTVLLLPLLVFIKQAGENGYGGFPESVRLTIGWGGVSANEPGAGIVMSQPLASVLNAPERHIFVPLGTGSAGSANTVSTVTTTGVTVGPGLAISVGANDVMAGAPDATRSLVVWTLYQPIRLPV